MPPFQITNRNMQLENENRRLTELLESRTPTAEPNPTQHREQRSVSVVRTVSQPRPATAPVSNGADSSVWATVARRAPKKKTTAKPRSVESAARAFQEPTGPSGFDYIYIPRSRRLTRKEVRTRLQTMKVDPYRVLDITFPARSVVGLLIHAQYKDTLLDRLAKANIRPRLDFDPCDLNYRGSQGVSALVSPGCPMAVVQFPVHTKYGLGLRLGRSLRLICLYLPPSLSHDEVSTALVSLPMTDDTIICGDLNARLGAVTGDSVANARGSVLLRWCEERGLTILNSTLAHGVPTFMSFRGNRVQHSVIDFFLTNMDNLQSPKMQVAAELSLGSDHKLMSLSFDYPVPDDHPTEPDSPSSSARRLWNLSRLQELDVRQLYVAQFQSLVSPLVETLSSIKSSPPTSQPPIDAFNDTLNEAIYSALDKTVGPRPNRPAHWCCIRTTLSYLLS
ncbi:unnamed protein product [Rhizopus stolonifer]